MNVILFGATGMVGQGALRECLLDPAVDQVLCVGRSATGKEHPKLEEIVLADLFDLSPIAPHLAGFDACLFCLGVSSLGMTEAEYRRITYDLTIAVARTLAEINPSMRFVYVTGTGTDSTEKGRVAWARIKGATENELGRVGFRSVHSFRPAYIQPLHGIEAKTAWLRVFYKLLAPLYPLWRRLLPGWVTTTETLGRAMLRAAKGDVGQAIVENREINALGASAAAEVAD